jgi:hypothetical protein
MKSQHGNELAQQEATVVTLSCGCHVVHRYKYNDQAARWTDYSESSLRGDIDRWGGQA